MKKLFLTTVSSVLTLSSMALSISPQANALTSNHQQDPFAKQITSPTYPQPNFLKSSSDNLTAAVYCERRGNRICCADSYGNMSCYWA